MLIYSGPKKYNVSKLRNDIIITAPTKVRELDQRRFFTKTKSLKFENIISRISLGKIGPLSRIDITITRIIRNNFPSINSCYHWNGVLSMHWDY